MIYDSHLHPTNSPRPFLPVTTVAALARGRTNLPPIISATIPLRSPPAEWMTQIIHRSARPRSHAFSCRGNTFCSPLGRYIPARTPSVWARQGLLDNGFSGAFPEHFRGIRHSHPAADGPIRSDVQSCAHEDTDLCVSNAYDTAMARTAVAFVRFFLEICAPATDEARTPAHARSSPGARTGTHM